MNDTSRTKKDLIQENALLRQRVREMEGSEADRQRMEEALREEKETFYMVLENYPTGVLLVGSDGAYLYLNPEFTRITGYTIEDIPSSREWLRKAYPDPDYRKMVVDTWKRDRLSYMGSAVDREFTITRMDGRTRVVNIRTTFMKNFSITGIKDVTERKRAEEALRESEIKYRRIFESLEDGYFQTDREGRIRIISPSIEQTGGWGPEELIGRPATEVYVESHHREGLLSILLEKGFVRDYDVALKKKDGTPVQVSVNGRLLFDDDGKPDGICGVIRDITDRKRAEEALQYEKAFLDAVINCSQEGIYLLDVERHRVLENQRARDLWKMPEDVDDDEARLLHMIRSLKDATPLREKLAYLHAHPEDSVHVELELKDGTVLDGHSSPISSESGKTYGRLWTFRDITELRHNAQMLEKLSVTDALTSLANRRHFDAVLEQEWQRAIRNQSSIALIMIDIDLFKSYNDRYGHPMGDECLRLVASAIAKAAHRPSDLAARYGGEEFAYILPNTDLKGALVVAQTILESVRALDIPHLSSSVAEYVTVSAGAAALIPLDGAPTSRLIEMADMSLYQAKLAGRNQVRSARQQEGEN